MSLSPQSYIQALKTALNNSPIIQEWTIVEESSLADRGHFRVRFVTEKIGVPKKKNY